MIDTDTQVIGFGVASLGIPIAADRLGCLHDLMTGGLVFVEKNSSLDSWTSLAYHIEGNSSSDDFVSGFSQNGIFASSFLSIQAHRLMRYAPQSVPLTIVAKFFQRVAQDYFDFTQNYSRSGVLFDREVSRLTFQADGKVISYDDQDRPLVRSNYVVLAMGAEEPSCTWSDIGLGSDDETCQPSENILRGECDSQLEQAVAFGKLIVIAGGSHSGFSVARYLLEKFGQQIMAGQVVIRTRNKIKYHYDTLESAKQENPDMSEQIVDPETGQVNRTTGLRGQARELARRILDGGENRVFVQFGSGGYQGDRKKLVIYAAGYSPRKINITDAAGAVVNLRYLNSNASLSPEGNVIEEGGQVLLNIFALGLGYAKSSVQGPLIGVNFFHAAAKEIVQNGLVGNTLLADSCTIVR